MTNAEKYREKIENYKGVNFCMDFVKPLVLEEKGLSCSGVACNHCYMLQMIWLMDEYKEPETDWGKVEIDTLILVRDCYNEVWLKRYFAKYENGKVYAWADGATSWSSDDITCGWKYAKLAEKGDE